MHSGRFFSPSIWFFNQEGKLLKEIQIFSLLALKALSVELKELKERVTSIHKVNWKTGWFYSPFLPIWHQSNTTVKHFLSENQSPSFLKRIWKGDLCLNDPHLQTIDWGSLKETKWVERLSTWIMNIYGN